tara:strand:- start:8193 stop:8399 length:207 start_codon:yes stop_codon:yes gene_type:complete
MKVRKEKMSKSLKILRKEFLKKYSGKITGYEHLDDGTGDYSKSPAGLEDGTDELVSSYKNVTPGEEKT